MLFNQLEDLFTAIINAKDVDDRPLHTVFQLLPSRKKYPSYYEVTENPIDLKMIAMKIQQGNSTPNCFFCILVNIDTILLRILF